MPSPVLFVVGSRPEAIKLAPVIAAVRETPSLQPIVCSTGQQQDLIPVALSEFGIVPDVALETMTAGQSLARLTSRIMAGLDEVIASTKPGWVVVQGDTSSAMTGAIAGFYHRVPVAHVEAGMRTHDRESPYPEEVNRRVIAPCASLHLAATARGQENLLREGVAPDDVVVTGNTVIDALLWMRRQVETRPSTLPDEIASDLAGRRLLFVTAHRRENFAGGIERICAALRRIVDAREDVVVVLAVHPNPSVRRVVLGRLSGVPRIHLIKPLPYSSTVELMDLAELVLTDSGGLQEEAPALGTPVIVLRDTTERPEGVDAGAACLVGTATDAIVERTLHLLDDAAAYARMSTAGSPYGDGRAAQRIAALLAGGRAVEPFVPAMTARTRHDGGVALLENTTRS